MENTVVLESGLEVTGATLLTAEEAGKLPEETLAIDDWWWLHSPGIYSNDAACVDSDGSVSCSGYGVNFFNAVRPALIVDLTYSNLQIGGQFWFGEKEFEIISADRALCAESVGNCAFREDWKTDNANDYEASDVKKFVDSWYQGVILQLSQKKKRSETENRNNVTLENGLEVTGATLLTVEKAKKLSEETRAIGEWWWLRSPGGYGSRAAGVNSGGFVYYFGAHVNSYDGAVRPALKLLNLKSSNLKIGDKFWFGEKEFKIISDTHALCTESIGHCVFREDWQAKDANDYEASDVKKFVDSWYQGIILQLSQKKEKSKMENRNNVTLENGLEITGATLLTVEEAEKLPEEIMVFPHWWWLQSPGMAFCTAYVSADGIVCRNGNDTSFSNGAVRPALKISNLESSGLSIGDYFRFGTEFGENEFKIISGTRALCTGSIGNCVFQTNQDVEDTRDYEISNVKRVVDEWYSKAICNIRKEEICHTKIRQAAQYLRDCIPCREIEPTCGIYIGCMECPYNQFRETVLTAFDVVLHDNSAGKLFESYITENISDKSIRMQSQSILNRINDSKENNRTGTTEKSKMENRNNITLENGLEVTGATLLTAEEARKLPKKNRAIREWWWLGSPGYILRDVVAGVDPDGSVYRNGVAVNDNSAVRPVLIVNLTSSNLTIGDRFRFGKKEFEIISGTRALCTESIGNCAFRTNWRAEDANDYEASDIKKFVDIWYRNAVNEVSQTDTTKKERRGQKMDGKTNISVHDAISTTTRCGKTEKEKEKEQLRECVENCIGIIDRLILEEAAKGNEQITIVRADLRREISEDFYDTFVNADFQHDIIPELIEHYHKKHFRSCEIIKPYPVHPNGIEIHWEKNPVKRFFSAHDVVAFPLLLTVFILILCIVLCIVLN